MSDPITPSQVVIAVEEQKPIPVVLAPGSAAALAGDASAPSVEAPPQAATGTPVNVTVMAPPPPPMTVTKGEGLALSPTTTEQEDIVVGRQAEIGKIWEWTQSVLSVLITVAVIYAELTGVSSVTLGNAFFFVVSLYLIRTNHVKIGGEGPKANEMYRGR